MKKLNASELVTLTKENCNVLFVSVRNNIVVEVNTDTYTGKVTIHKNYFNRIHIDGFVQGMFESLSTDMVLFKGFNFK
jgi:hypothetical protein